MTRANISCPELLLGLRDEVRAILIGDTEFTPVYMFQLWRMVF